MNNDKSLQWTEEIFPWKGHAWKANSYGFEYSAYEWWPIPLYELKIKFNDLSENSIRWGSLKTVQRYAQAHSNVVESAMRGEGDL